MTSQIRTATDGDASALATLLEQLGHPATPERILSRLARMANEAGQHVLVAELEGTVVGLATVWIRHLITADTPLARIGSLVVDDARRSQRIGRQLVTAAETIAREAGCDRIEVTSGEHRTRAHDFYRALGYEERPRRFVKRL
ncbi:MAG: GNAT family N-acetyltransferase [Kofleriaceae bacterium]